MTNAATQLAYHDLVLRSGAAGGADAAFEAGCPPHQKEIFLPWNGFNGRRFQDEKTLYYGVCDRAKEIASQFHPAWDKLTPAIRCLMARNTYQVLGPALDDPVLFVLCWTPEGKSGGGTGQAIRIAKGLDIPVFDFGAMSLEEIQDGIEKLI
jgi:hypothetical protein